MKKTFHSSMFCNHNFNVMPLKTLTKIHKMELGWKEFSSHTKELLNNLYNDQSLADVTIVSDDQVKFKAHKFVLQACSKALKNLLKNEDKGFIIYLRGIQHQELKPLLNFMYLGEAKIDQERLTEFISIAKNLEVKGMEENFEFSNRSNDFLAKSELIDIDIIDEAIKDINGSSHETQKDSDDDLDVERSFSDVDVDEVITVNEDKEESVQETDTVKSDSDKLDKSHDGRPEIKVSDIKSVTTNFAKVPNKEKTEKIKNLSRDSCNECDYKGTPRALVHHKKSKHEGVVFPCPECDVILSRETHLNKHRDAVHKGLKFQCPHCDYKATQKGNLNRHIWWRHS